MVNSRARDSRESRIAGNVPALRSDKSSSVSSTNSSWLSSNSSLVASTHRSVKSLQHGRSLHYTSSTFCFFFFEGGGAQWRACKYYDAPLHQFALQAWIKVYDLLTCRLHTSLRMNMYRWGAAARKTCRNLCPCIRCRSRCSTCPHPRTMEGMSIHRTQCPHRSAGSICYRRHCSLRRNLQRHQTQNDKERTRVLFDGEKRRSKKKLQVKTGFITRQVPPKTVEYKSQKQPIEVEDPSSSSSSSRASSAFSLGPKVILQKSVFCAASLTHDSSLAWA